MAGNADGRPRQRPVAGCVHGGARSAATDTRCARGSTRFSPGVTISPGGSIPTTFALRRRSAWTSLRGGRAGARRRPPRACPRPRGVFAMPGRSTSCARSPWTRNRQRWPCATPIARSRRSIPSTSPSLSTGSAPRYSTLVRAFPALHGARRGIMAPCATAPPACLMSPLWASTCCTCRRSIRLGARAARGATTRSRQEKTISGVRGRLAPRRVGTRRSTRCWARWRIFARSPKKRARADSSSPSTSPSSAPPIILTRKRIRSGSGTARTAASSTPRTHPRSTRTSIRSTSRPSTGRRCGRSSTA